MKASPSVKLILYMFATLIQLQTYEVAFTLMNKPDSFIANIGLALFFTNIACTVYCLVQIYKQVNSIIKKQNKDEK